MKSILKTFILLINSVNSILTLETIQKVNSDIIDNGSNNISFFRLSLNYFIPYPYVSKNDLQYTILNPLLGYLSLKNGLIANFRFFNPFIEISYDYFDKRCYDKDKSPNRLAKAFITLFPSHSGILHTHKNFYKSFTTNYFCRLSKNKKIANAEHLANILIKIINDEKYDKNKLKKGIQEDLGKLLLLFNGEKVIKGQKDLKILLINAYAVSVLDTETLYRAYANILFNIKTNKINPEPLNEEEKKEFSSLYKNLDVSNLPYSKPNQPETSFYIQSYQKKNGCFNYEKFFSDDFEIPILHLCNCLFYDKNTKKYNLEHLQLDEDSALKKFYERFGRDMLPITEETRNEWSKVVKILKYHIFDDFNDCDTLITEKYMEKYRKELKSGIINIVSILCKICSSSSNNIMEVYDKFISRDYIDTSNIADLFINFLNNLVNPKKMKISLLNKKNIKELEIDERFDFTGEIEIGFEAITKACNQYKDSMKLEVSNNKYEISCEENINTLSKSEFESLRNNKGSSTVISLIKSYLSIVIEKKNEVTKPLFLSPIKRYISVFFEIIGINIKNSDTSNCLYLYNQGTLDTSQQKINYLEKLVRIELKEDTNKEFLPDFRKICENIMRSPKLKDSEIRYLFLRFFCFSEYLISTIKDEEINDICNKLCLENDNSDIKILKDSWNEIIKNKLNTIEYIFDRYILSVEDSIRILESWKDYLKKVSFKRYYYLEDISAILSNLSSLTSLDLSNNSVNLIEYAAQILEKNKSLTSLDLSCNEIKANNIEVISNALKNINTLKSLSLKDCNLNTNCFEKLLVSLKNNKHLEFLDVSSNNFCENEALALSSYLENNKHLKYLNIGDNFIKSESIKDIFKTLEGNKKLNTIDISSTHVRSDDIKNIFESLNLTAIRKIILFDNQFYLNKGISMILKLIDNNRKLKVVDLTSSHHSLSKIAKDLENNTFFESLDLSYNTNSSRFTAVYDRSIVQDNNAFNTLRLSNNKLNGDFLYQIIENNKTLKEINLSNNIFDFKSILKLANALQKNNTLVYLYLRSSFDDLTIESFKTLINILKDHKSTKHVDLSDNGCLNSDVYINLIKELKLKRDDIEVIV